MAIFGALPRRSALRSYARKLPRQLRADYGASSSYTPQQSEKAIERLGLSGLHRHHAVALFSGREAFEAYYPKVDPASGYDLLREQAIAIFREAGFNPASAGYHIGTWLDASSAAGSASWHDTSGSGDATSVSTPGST